MYVEVEELNVGRYEEGVNLAIFATFYTPQAIVMLYTVAKYDQGISNSNMSRYHWLKNSR